MHHDQWLRRASKQRIDPNLHPEFHSVEFSDSCGVAERKEPPEVEDWLASLQSPFEKWSTIIGWRRVVAHGPAGKEKAPGLLMKVVKYSRC